MCRATDTHTHDRRITARDQGSMPGVPGDWTRALQGKERGRGVGKEGVKQLVLLVLAAS